MPTTATGKIRRHALRAVVRGRIDVRGGVDAVESLTDADAIPGSRRSTVPPSSRSFAPSSRISFPRSRRSTTTPLAHAGLHSVAAVELSRRLNVALRRPNVRRRSPSPPRLRPTDGSRHRRLRRARRTRCPRTSMDPIIDASLLSPPHPPSPPPRVSPVDRRRFPRVRVRRIVRRSRPRRRDADRDAGDRWDLEATGGLLVASDRDRADPSEMASIVTRHASYLAEDAFACDPKSSARVSAELAAMDPSHRDSSFSTPPPRPWTHDSTRNSTRNSTARSRPCTWGACGAASGRITSRRSERLGRAVRRREHGLGSEFHGGSRRVHAKSQRRVRGDRHGVFVVPRRDARGARIARLRWRRTTPPSPRG